MRGWRFVIDESGFAFDDESPSAVEGSFAAFLGVLEYTRSTPAQVRRSDLLFDIESASGRSLVDHLCDREIDRDLRTELWSRLDRTTVYEEVPDEFECDIDGVRTTFAPSACVALSKALGGYDLACLSTEQAGRSGVCSVSGVADHPASGEVYFIAREADAPGFWRRLLRRDRHDDADLDGYSELSFPNLVFAEGIWNQISRFEGPRLVVWPILMDTLAGLDDFAVEVWSEQVEPHRRMEQMRLRARVDCSPESPKTHANVKAMKTRTVTFSGDPVVCEWHAKLERHRNRVHFAVRGGRVYVGIFVDHLVT